MGGDGIVAGGKWETTRRTVDPKDWPVFVYRDADGGLTAYGCGHCGQMIFRNDFVRVLTEGCWCGFPITAALWGQYFVEVTQ